MTITELYGAFKQSTGISIDSRNPVPGSLFFAIKGERFDGNDFAGEALEKGCRLAVADREDLVEGNGIVKVPSALLALQDLAAYHRTKLKTVILAITGSNGKTTTKELAGAVLSKKMQVYATRGNLNNHIGVPLTLLSLSDEEIAVVEMGANHPGEIRKLAEIASPDYGLITNIGMAHLEGFGSLEGVLQAKGELYDFLARSGGVAFVNGEDRLLLERVTAAGAKFYRYGEGMEIPVQVKMIRQDPYLHIRLVLAGEPYEVNTHFAGLYNLDNIRTAAALGSYFQVEPGKILEAIGEYLPSNQRSQVISGNRNQLVLDAYNANPTSMRAAIESFRAYASDPSMLILGDMAEVGAGAGEEHRELLAWIKKFHFTRVLLVGPLFGSARSALAGAGEFEWFPSLDALEQGLEHERPEGFHILIKGSRKMTMEKVTKRLND